MAVLAESVEQVVEVLERFRIPQLAELRRLALTVLRSLAGPEMLWAAEGVGRS